MNLDRKGERLPEVTVTVEPVRFQDYLVSVGGADLQFGDEVLAPMFFGPTVEGSDADLAAFLDIDFAKGLLGEIEYVVERPPRLGERITVSRTIVDTFQKEGRSGATSFAVLEVTFRDEAGETIFVQRVTFIERP